MSPLNTLFCGAWWPRDPVASALTVVSLPPQCYRWMSLASVDTWRVSLLPFLWNICKCFKFQTAVFEAFQRRSCCFHCNVSTMHNTATLSTKRCILAAGVWFEVVDGRASVFSSTRSSNWPLFGAFSMNLSQRFLLPIIVGQTDTHKAAHASGRKPRHGVYANEGSVLCFCCCLQPCCHRHGDPGGLNSTLPSLSLSPVHKDARPDPHYTYHYGAHALYMI